jgi:hypothetical protein
MTPEEQAAYQARQRSRSVVLGWVLGALVIIFFLVTIAKQS